MFLNYINMKHPNIKFTMETEVSKCLSFLDVSINNNFGFSTSVYRKSTFTGLLTNFFSYTADSYKIGLIKNLLFRAFHICDSWVIFHNEVERIYQILLKNSFPRVLIDRVTCSFIEKQVRMKEDDSSVKEIEQEVRYFKLPYRGRFSDLTQSKLNNIAKRFCKPIKAKLVFTPFKISQYFSPKDRIPDKYRSNVVYKYICPSCEALYIGETSIHFNTRVSQHLFKRSAPSAVNKHLHAKGNERCRELSDRHSFSVIDRASTKFSLKLKEAMHIRWNNEPPLNKQVRSVKLQLTV